MRPVRHWRTGLKLLIGAGGERLGGAGTGDYGLDPFFEGRTGKENAVLTSEAADSDVCAEAVDLPVAAAAGVRLAHSDYVSEGELLRHCVRPLRQPQLDIR